MSCSTRWLLFTLCCYGWLISQTQPTSAQDASVANDFPNVVIILADDLGYGDVSCYNRERGKISTPHIDGLAEQGMRFTDAHSSSAVCSPSRYTLLTGRYHWRTRLQKGIVGLWGPPLIAPDRSTLATLFHKQGYQTACIGKWHLGWDWPIAAEEKLLFRGNKAKETAATNAHRQAWNNCFSQPIPGGPITRGFETYFGTDVPNWPPFCFIEQDKAVGIPSEFLPIQVLRKNQASIQGPAMKSWRLEPILPTLAERTSQYIREAAQRNRPYFVYMPLTSPHTPLAVNEAWLGKSKLNLYADFVMETDAAVGKVLQAIEESGTGEETLVLFTSDNGYAPYTGVDELEDKGHYPSGPLRGYKSDVWEGGHRVPFIVRWPKKVIPGTLSHQLVHHADVYATIASVLGVKVSDAEAEDSFSLVPLLLGTDQPIREAAVSQSSQGLISIRKGAWKLIFGSGSGGWGKDKEDFPVQLYDLSNDLGEKNNVAASETKIVEELTNEMEKLVKNGRSNQGAMQSNDQPFNWKRFLKSSED